MRLLGALNGFLVAFFRVPALVVTLGTMYAFRGYLTNQVGSKRIVAGDIPANFERIGTQQIADDPGADAHRAWSCWPSSATTCTPHAAAASSTRSAPTPTPPASTA